MGRGSYLGGSTIIYAGYGYVSRLASNGPKRNAKKSAAKNKKNAKSFHLTFYNSPKRDHEHFGSNAKKAFLFADKFRNIIAMAKKRGYASAADFAKLFNKNDLPTACGAPWTPHLCAILIRLVASFNSKRPNDPKARSGAISLPRKQVKKEFEIIPRTAEVNDGGQGNAEPPLLSYSKDEIAGRLTRIGRVIYKGPDSQGKR